MYAYKKTDPFLIFKSQNTFNMIKKVQQKEHFRILPNAPWISSPVVAIGRMLGLGHRNDKLRLYNIVLIDMKQETVLNDT